MRYQDTMAILLMGPLIVAMSSVHVANANDERGASQARSVLVAPAQPTIFSPQRQQTTLDAKAVRASINRGIQFLKSKQTANGSWPQHRWAGDVTALAVLALINAEDGSGNNRTGISAQVKRALDYLQNIAPSNTYMVSLRVMAMATADPAGKKYRLSIQKDVDWLLDNQVKGGVHHGSWGYGGAGQGDASNSQFALLALHEASRIGVKIPRANWIAARDYWTKTYRKRSGGFGYSASGNETRSTMTCAGISSWIIIHENLVDVADGTNGDFAKCCQENAELEPVETALQWLTRNYSISRGQYYLMYGLERAARLAGRRFIGPNDWYRDGAKELLKRQNPNNGYWKGSAHGEDNPLIATSMALLFLSKGKRPVVIGKLNHGSEDWNLHPQGIHYLTRRIESDWKQKLNWQTVKSENATVDDLLEAPVLFMSGRDAIGLTQSQKDVLKKYIENGGFLFAEACSGDGCGESEIYDAAFRNLMAQLFPDSQLEALPATHPIWYASPKYLLQPNAERPLLGLQACCRTSVVYCPKNLSCYWALNQRSIVESDKISRGLKNRIEYCANLGVNVVAYATGREVKEKGATPKLNESKVALLEDRVLVFPKLSHDGGDDEAPNAWRKVIGNVQRFGLEIKTEKKMVSATTEQMADYPFIFMHGRERFRWTKEQRQAIRDHLELGGFIFADSICASSAFTKSFLAEMEAALQAPLEPIPGNDEIWTDPRFGYRINRVTLRTKGSGTGGFVPSSQPPALLGAKLNGRWAVVFSPNDLSCALENTSVSQCTGYTREDAIKIGTNVVLYSLLSDRK